MRRIARTLATLTIAMVLAIGVGSLSTGCGKPKVKCSKLCKKMGNCFFEIMKKKGALTKRTAKSIKKNDALRKMFKKKMRKSCKKTCKKHNKKGKWSRKDAKRVKKCLGKSSCKKFAKCITKYVY